MLRRKIQTLGDAIDRCSSGLAELEHVLDLTEGSEYAVLCVLPPHQCYVCLEYHRHGLVWCSTCAAALCAGCVQDLVGSLIDSGSVAAANGEAAIFMCAVCDVGLARDHTFFSVYVPYKILGCQVMCKVCNTGTHPLVLMRRRLSDETFESLLEARDGAKAARAANMALELAILGEPINEV